MRTKQRLNQDDRVFMVLDREARRVREAAERVCLVVRAAALRRGLDVQPVTDDDV